jgi:hypothetical protein
MLVAVVARMVVLLREIDLVQDDRHLFRTGLMIVPSRAPPDSAASSRRRSRDHPGNKRGDDNRIGDGEHWRRVVSRMGHGRS